MTSIDRRLKRFCSPRVVGLAALVIALSNATYAELTVHTELEIDGQLLILPDLDKFFVVSETEVLAELTPMLLGAASSEMSLQAVYLHEDAFAESVEESGESQRVILVLTANSRDVSAANILQLSGTVFGPGIAEDISHESLTYNNAMDALSGTSDNLPTHLTRSGQKVVLLGQDSRKATHLTMSAGHLNDGAGLHGGATLLLSLANIAVITKVESPIQSDSDLQWLVTTSNTLSKKLEALNCETETEFDSNKCRDLSQLEIPEIEQSPTFTGNPSGTTFEDLKEAQRSVSAATMTLIISTLLSIFAIVAFVLRRRETEDSEVKKRWDVDESDKQ